MPGQVSLVVNEVSLSDMYAQRTSQWHCSPDRCT